MDNKLSELSKPVAWKLHHHDRYYFEENADVVAIAESMGQAKGDAVYSQEYVSALDKVAQFWIGESAGWKKRAEDAEKRIAELEAQVKVWESAALKHLARAEEAEKRLPILEKDKLRLNEIINSEANRADEAEKRLATPVRLPRPACTYADHSYPAYSRNQVEEILSSAGMCFTVEGDE